MSPIAAFSPELLPNLSPRPTLSLQTLCTEFGKASESFLAMPRGMRTLHTFFVSIVYCVLEVECSSIWNAPSLWHLGTLARASRASRILSLTFSLSLSLSPSPPSSPRTLPLYRLLCGLRGVRGYSGIEV